MNKVNSNADNDASVVVQICLSTLCKYCNICSVYFLTKSMGTCATKTVREILLSNMTDIISIFVIAQQQQTFKNNPMWVRLAKVYLEKYISE